MAQTARYLASKELGWTETKFGEYSSAILEPIKNDPWYANTIEYLNTGNSNGYQTNLNMMTARVANCRSFASSHKTISPVYQKYMAE